MIYCLSIVNAHSYAAATTQQGQGVALSVVWGVSATWLEGRTGTAVIAGVCGGAFNQQNEQKTDEGGVHWDSLGMVNGDMYCTVLIPIEVAIVERTNYMSVVPHFLIQGELFDRFGDQVTLVR